MRLATLLLVLVLSTAAASAQTSQRASVYADAFGPGGVYSIGAEVPIRSLGSGQLVGRVGVSAVEGIGGDLENAVVTVPATLAYVQPVVGILGAELGAGLTAAAAAGFGPGATEPVRRLSLFPHVSAAARLDAGRFALRLGAAALADVTQPSAGLLVLPVAGIGVRL